VLFVPLGTIGT